MKNLANGTFNILTVVTKHSSVSLKMIINWFSETIFVTQNHDSFMLPINLNLAQSRVYPKNLKIPKILIIHQTKGSTMKSKSSILVIISLTCKST